MPVKLLLAHDADPDLRTRIDRYTTPIEDAQAIGFTAAVDLMLEARSKTPVVGGGLVADDDLDRS